MLDIITRTTIQSTWDQLKEAVKNGAVKEILSSGGNGSGSAYGSGGVALGFSI